MCACLVSKEQNFFRYFISISTATHTDARRHTIMVLHASSCVRDICQIKQHAPVVKWNGIFPLAEHTAVCVGVCVGRRGYDSGAYCLASRMWSLQRQIKCHLLGIQCVAFLCVFHVFMIFLFIFIILWCSYKIYTSTYITILTIF